MENLNQDESSQAKLKVWFDKFNDINPLSRFLAVVMIFSLPILGFWLGLEYGLSFNNLDTVSSSYYPDYSQSKKPIIAPVENNDGLLETASTTSLESWLYTNEEFGFSVLMPNEISRSVIIKDMQEGGAEIGKFKTIDFSIDENPASSTGRAIIYSLVIYSQSEFEKEFELITNDSEEIQIAYLDESAVGGEAYLGKSDKYIFGLKGPQECFWDGLMCDVNDDRKTDLIMDSFKVF